MSEYPRREDDHQDEGEGGEKREKEGTRETRMRETKGEGGRWKMRARCLERGNRLRRETE